MNSMKKRLGISAIVFDMDGVIVDSEPFHLMAKQMVFELYGIDYTERHNREYLGRKDLHMFQDMVKKRNMNIGAERLVMAKEAILCQLLINKALPCPGVLEILLNARREGLPLAVASSGAASAVNLVLELFGIRHFFSSVSTGDDVHNGKPAPDVYLRATRQLNIDPAYCLAIEDTANGIAAAKSAGLIACAIPCKSTEHEDHSYADMRIKKLDDLDLQRLVRMPIRKALAAS